MRVNAPSVHPCILVSISSVHASLHISSHLPAHPASHPSFHSHLVQSSIHSSTHPVIIRPICLSAVVSNLPPLHCSNAFSFSIHLSVLHGPYHTSFHLLAIVIQVANTAGPCTHNGTIDQAFIYVIDYSCIHCLTRTIARTLGKY